MKISKPDREFGRDAKNNVGYVKEKSFDGALAGLETFYFSFNNKDLDTFKKMV
jgi:hypothetical protein